MAIKNNILPEKDEGGAPEKEKPEAMRPFTCSSRSRARPGAARSVLLLVVAPAPDARSVSFECGVEGGESATSGSEGLVVDELGS
jgi:hypothetical protein